ncbi:MAG TPA: peptidoglycan-associated lipoprotein Pal [Burkholderiales bacterium]|nr:peptidoglycan-associated lipoprotein Pal [Burkholderiales bacterium]
MRAILITALSATSLLLAAGCQTTPEEQQPSAAVEDRKPGAAKPGADARTVERPKIAAVDVTAGKPDASRALKDPNSILSKRQIFFDYDKYDVKDEYRPLVEAHAKYLRENPSAKMLIQGNADERGSREYNIALGQRRSDNVRRMLILLGARDAQLESVSLGEEKPMCADHNEQCWSKNRRGDMLYSGEY